MKAKINLNTIITLKEYTKIMMMMRTKTTTKGIYHNVKFSLFISILIVQILMMMMMMTTNVSGLSVDGNIQQNPPILLNDVNEKHQSINSQQAIEIMKVNKGSTTGNIEIERNADRMKDDDNFGIQHDSSRTTRIQRMKQTDTATIEVTTAASLAETAENKLPLSFVGSNTRKSGSSSSGSSTSSSSSSGSISLPSNNGKHEIFECGSPENLQKGQFTGYDYAIVLGMLGISLGIGAFYGFFHKSGSGSSNEFLLGSEMSIFPVTLSLTTSFITAIELLGNPSEMFYQGTQFSLIVIPMVLVIPVAVKMFYPIYYKLDLTSCYEYLGIRFGKDLRIMGALLYIVQMSFYTAVAVLAPAIALSKATGLNTRLAVALIYIVCIFYSSQGGMKAVVIADTFQACVLAASLVLIIVLGTFYTGGISDIFEKASEHKRLEFLNFDPDPTTRHTVFSVVIGGFFYWASLFCTNQASVQKCMSLKSLKLAKLALGFAILGLIVVFLINFYTGLMVFTHYSDCDPLSSGQIGATDQLLPFYVMDIYAHIYTITGIFVAGIFAASLGTVASALNSLAAVTCEDILINGFNIKIRPEKGALYAKWMSLGYGVFSFILVFVVERLGGVLQATLTLNGLVGGVTLGLFVLGIVFKRANAKGAFYGGIIALVLVIYIGVMAQITNVDPKPLPLSMEKCNCFVSNITTIKTLSSVQGQKYPVYSDKEGVISKLISDDETKILSTIEISTQDTLMMMMIADRIMNESNVNNNNANSIYGINSDVNRNNSSTSSSGNGSNMSVGNFTSDHNHHQNHIDDRLRRINDDDDTLNKDNNGQGFSFSSIYRISYMWYSMIGALLTIIFGLIISIVSDAITKHKVLKITQQQQQQQQQHQQHTTCHENEMNSNCSVTLNFGSNNGGGISNCVSHNNLQKIATILNENLRAHYKPEHQIVQMNCPKKIGIDNFALKIDDEK